MFITDLEFDNVKGTSQKLHPCAVNVISGRNSVGKSAVIDALTIGLLGHHPSLGKTAPATYRLASGEVMRVALHYAEGGSVERKWKANPKGGVSASLTGEATVGLPAAVLDPSAFIGANAKARLEMLAHLVNGEAIRALQEKCGTWAQSMKVEGDDDVITWAKQLRDRAGELAKREKEAADRHRQTLATLSLHEGTAAEVTHAELEAAQAEATRSDRAYIQARGQAGHLEEREQQAIDAAEELETLGDVTGYRDYSEALAEARQELEKAKSVKTAAALLVAGTEREQTAHTKACGQYGTDGERIGQRIEELEEMGDPAAQYQNAAAEVARLSGELAKATAENEGNVRELAAVKSQLQGLGGMEVCPTCHACAPGWKDGVTGTLTARRDELAAAVEFKAGNIGDLSDMLASSRMAMAGFAKDMEAVKTLPALRRAFDAAVAISECTGKLVGQREAVSAASDAVGELEEKVRELQDEQAEAEKTKTAAQRAGELHAIIAARPSSEDVAAANEAFHDAEQAATTAKYHLGNLIERREAGIRASETSRRADECRTAAATHAQEAEAWDKKKKEIASTLEETIKNTYGPIIDAAHFFGSGVWEGELREHEGELGMLRGPAFVPFECLSGTEKLVVSAAIQCALSFQSGGIVVLDELSRMDRDRKRAFVYQIHLAIQAGRLAQAFLVDHDGDAWGDLQFVNVIKIDG